MRRRTPAAGFQSLRPARGRAAWLRSVWAHRALPCCLATSTMLPRLHERHVMNQELVCLPLIFSPAGHPALLAAIQAATPLTCLMFGIVSALVPGRNAQRLIRRPPAPTVAAPHIA